MRHTSPSGFECLNRVSSPNQVAGMVNSLVEILDTQRMPGKALSVILV
jgi:hypothetical protein